MNEIELFACLCLIQEMANRASFVLNEFIVDYGFTENPNPAKALELGADASIEAKQSFQWFLDYNRIYTLIEIASDYVEKIEKLAEDKKKGSITNANQSL